MENEYGKLGKTYSFAVVIRGSLPEINDFIKYLDASPLRVAHREISSDKLWIKREVFNEKE